MAYYAEKIYSVLPVNLQNIIVSMRGREFVKKRYNNEYIKALNSLMRTQWFSYDQFNALQNKLFDELIREAIQDTHYYRKTFEKIIDTNKSITMEILQDIPFLEKDILRKNTSEFINHSRRKYGVLEGHTSGTSGSPLVWPYDLKSMQWAIAFRARQYRWGGVTEHDRSARFSGNVVLGKHKSPPFWRHNKAENQWLFSIYHINHNTIELYYSALKNYDFAFLDGYPYALFTIAKWINQQGKSGHWRPWMINTTAETLTDYQRSEIELAFGCKIYNHYSSSEGAPFVTQCSAGRMHLNPESGIIEFIKPDGSYASPGEDAEMVVTSFFQRSIPLIRYRIGDTGALAENQDCPCGRKMPVIKYIGGRESDTIYTTERGHIGTAGMGTVFYSVPSRILGSQLEQIGTDKFIFRYVPLNSPLDDNERKNVIDRFRDRLGKSVEIKIEEVEKIEPGANGKIRLIIGLNDK